MNEITRAAGSQRFPRSARVVKGADFQRAYREGSRAKGATLIVVARSNGLEHSRLGLSVGRACWKSAVKRNRVKRVWREAFRLERAELPRGFDLILIPAANKLEPELAPTRTELVAIAARAVARSKAKLG